MYAIEGEGALQTNLANFADNSFEFWQIACLAKRTFLVGFPSGQWTDTSTAHSGSTAMLNTHHNSTAFPLAITR